MGLLYVVKKKGSTHVAIVVCGGGAAVDYVNSNRTAKAREPSNLFDGLLTDRLTNNRINSAIGTEMKPESNDLLIYYIIWSERLLINFFKRQLKLLALLQLCFLLVVVVSQFVKLS